MLRYVTTAEMQALERHAVEKYNISLEQMMQNAGKAVFDVVINEILPSESAIDQSHLLIICGKGNNGGDALVTARLLYEKGIDVSVYNLYLIDEMSLMAKTEMAKYIKSGIRFVEKFDYKYSLIIDGIFGFSLKGNPKLPEAKIIEQINCSHIPILSVDVPSGLDAHYGSIGQPTIKGDYTVALGLPKIGFKEHPEICGKIYIGDLGIPEQAYRDKGYDAPMFRGKSYISVN